MDRVAIMKFRESTFLVMMVVLATKAAADTTVDALPCTPIPFEETSAIPACVERVADGEYRLTKAGRAKLKFQDNGLTAIQIDGALYHANRNGRTAPALPVDNGADYLVEGLTRILRNGKVGFVDSHLKTAIAAAWDFAWPFDGGVATVCLGCRPVPQGEHVAIEGGLWVTSIDEVALSSQFNSNGKRCRLRQSLGARSSRRRRRVLTDERANNFGQ